jgi:SAM-dependent methyltransferase
LTDVWASLGPTGERTLPGLWHENYWYQRHLAAYKRVLSAGPAGVLLEAGCGEGYGASLLAGRCNAVVALDYDAATVAHVRLAYPGLPVVRGNLVALPLRERSVDWVVSLQTLEHLWDADAFVAECVRVLRPGGTLVVSTPNRLSFSPGLGPDDKPANPFHHKEFAPQDLLALLNRHADVDMMIGVRHGAAIRLWEHAHGSIVAAQLARPYQAWHADLVQVVTSLTTQGFVVSEQDLPSCLDLIAFVTPGRGPGSDTTVVPGG